jgi:Icc-related predicted phosphoesterase
MTLIRLQASDFQDEAEFQHNITKLEAIAIHANDIVKSGKKLAGVDLVGDFYEAHAVDNAFKSQIAQLAQQHPDAQKIFQRHKGDLLASIDEIVQLHDFEPLKKRLFQMLAQTVQDVYQNMDQIIAGINAPVYGVMGNTDVQDVYQILKSVKFTDIEDGVVENGPFRIAGANNTYELPFIIAHLFPAAGVHYDDHPDTGQSPAYQRLNAVKVGKKANIMQLHGPPNIEALRKIQTKKGEEYVPTEGAGISKLIEEHKPQLVECGHIHTAKLITVNGIRYARSSPNVYFEHHFDDNGNYLGTEVFEYARKG